MPWIAAVVAAAATIGSAVIGANEASKKREAALKANQDAVQSWLDVNIPDPEEQKIFLKKYVQEGKFDPSVEEALKQEYSNYEKIQTDPRLKQAQLKSLSSLEELGDGGLTLSDKADLQKGLIDINSADRGRRESILEGYDRRGMGGSGMELLAQLQGAQDASTQQSNQQLDTLGRSRDRALQAILKGGELSGSLRGQDYQEQSDLARARDAIQEFNTRNSQSVAQRNVDRANAAQEYNLGQAQRISDANTDLSNKEEVYNKGLVQQEFENKAKVAAGLTGQYGSLSKSLSDQGQATANQWSNIGTGVSGAATAYGNQQNNESLMDKYFASQKNNKISDSQGGSQEDLDEYDKWVKTYG